MEQNTELISISELDGLLAIGLFSFCKKKQQAFLVTSFSIKVLPKTRIVIGLDMARHFFIKLLFQIQI